jgi:hypothetical protein
VFLDLLVDVLLLDLALEAPEGTLEALPFYQGDFSHGLLTSFHRGIETLSHDCGAGRKGMLFP